MSGSDAFVIRPFRTVDDYRECVALQEATWGEGFSERVSAAVLQVAQRLGGVSAGAYDGAGRLAGFVFGMTGIDDEGLLHWSDMLAVRQELRDIGLGRRLKMYQREQLLSRGVERMIWTWDPLQSRNAYLNLVRLGAVAREYRRDMYGETDSVLHRGIGTDRLLALWRMRSPRVERRLAGEREAGVPTIDDAEQALDAASVTAAGDPVPGRARTDLAASVVSVAVPARVDPLKKRDLPLACAWREATRAAFESYLERGYEVRELVRKADVSHYLLVEGAGDASQETR